MFDLTPLSTHFSYGYMADSKVVNPLPPLHELPFSISSKGSFMYTIPETG